MTASSRGSKAAAGLIRSTRHPRVCSECSIGISRLSRSYSAAAIETSKPANSPPIASTNPPPPVTAHAGTAEYLTHAGVLLSRPPLLTQPLSTFEESFYFYQKRLNERLVMPFTRYFYFKKDTPALTDWKIKAAERGWQPARELGGYNPYRDEAWNDELLVGDPLSKTSTMVDALLDESVSRAVEGKDGLPQIISKDDAVPAERPLSRTTQADRAHDLKRLDRKLDSTLYLCVKRANGGGWGLPAGVLEGRESLLQAAERIMFQSAGANMNTWIVGHAPVGHRVQRPYYVETKLQRPGVKTFFMKGRIMAGQANLKGNLFGLDDFKWLTREELEAHVSAQYFGSIKNMLHER